MMNVNDTDMDLGLALGINNQCVQSIWNSGNTGAGANANTRPNVDRMTLVGSDSLTELVWSPQSGLNLKCAGSSSCFADKKPCFLWDAGPSNIGFSPSRGIRSGDTDDEKRISEGGSIASRATCHVDSEVAKCASSAKSPSSSAPGPLFGSTHGHAEALAGQNIGEVNSMENASVMQPIEMEDCNKGKEKKCLSCSKSVPADESERSETTGGPQIQRTADLLPLLAINADRADPLSEKLVEGGMTHYEGKSEDIGCGSNRLGFNIGLPLKIQAVTQCLPHEHPVPDLPSSMRKHVERGKGKMEEYGLSAAPFLDKMEATSENDIQDPIAKDAVLGDKKRARRGDLDPGEASSSDSRMCLPGWKGKDRQKSLSCGEGDEKDEDDSHGSMESCNSANLLQKGKRRWSFDQQLILGSKRIKKQTQECPFSTPMVKQDSSFMNWILNMVKGLGKSNQEEDHSFAPSISHPLDDQENFDQNIDVFDKTRDFRSKKLGFQTVFQSLYSPDARAQETRTQVENKSLGGSKEIVLAEKTCEAITAVVSYHGENDNMKQTAFVHEEGMSVRAFLSAANDGVSSLDSSHGAKTSNTISCMGNTSDPLGSLWITRLCPKAPSTLLNVIQSDHKSLEVRDTSIDDASGSVDLKKIGEDKYENLIVATPSETLKSPEEMASVFARRLDAFKHIKPTGGRENTAQLKTTCFFCGKTGHGVRDCLEIKENELEGLLRNISSYEGVAEETPCLCIKCFQLNHWASACPFASIVQLSTSNRRCFDMIKTKENQSEFGGSCSLGKRQMEIDFNFKQKVDGNVFSDRRVSSMDDIPKKLACTFGKDSFSNKEKIPPWGKLASERILEAPEEIFDTIRRLRLSRTDILKWINSHFSVTHLDGFFLRLRLAKWEEGLGGAGYYVASIAGSQGEKPSKGSKNPIRVNVGGVECMVESQYVSNCDFLEEELVAWWQKTSKIGRVPLEEDLKSKLKERKKLGL